MLELIGSLCFGVSELMGSFRVLKLIGNFGGVGND